MYPSSDLELSLRISIDSQKKKEKKKEKKKKRKILKYLLYSVKEMNVKQKIYIYKTGIFN